VIATTDWATVATFATAIGTLVLAVATFAAVRSSNRSARIAEEAFKVILSTGNYVPPLMAANAIGQPILTETQG